MARPPRALSNSRRWTCILDASLPNLVAVIEIPTLSGFGLALLGGLLALAALLLVRRTRAA